MKELKNDHIDRINHDKIFSLSAMLIFLGTVVLALIFYLKSWDEVPRKVFLKAGTEEILYFELPAKGILCKNAVPVSDGEHILIDLRDPLVLKTGQENSYQMKIDLFGVIPLKRMDIEVIQDVKLRPEGIPVGIYVKTEGVMVIDTGEFESEDGQEVSPSKNIFRPGDYILEVNDETVENKRQFMSMIEWSEGQDLIFKIRREDEELYVMGKAIADRNGEYKLGVWIRDNAQGVGTMTYLDEQGMFGALGHGINDMDTGKLLRLQNGKLYHTEIIGITKGMGGKPGELTGYIEYDDRNQLGSIQANTGRGIFGVCDKSLLENQEDDEFLAIGLKQEIQKGPATILCSFGEDAKEYQVEITDINLAKDHINRGIVLKVTDEELLEKTGGIIQGMSGSPIIQNHKIIGAVTHVFVNDPTRGYGIFIETMLEG